MKKAKWFVSLFLLMVLVSVHGQAQAQMISGNKLVEKMRGFERVEQGSSSSVSFQESSFFMGYVVGVCDVVDSLLNIPSGVKAGQLAHIVAKYLKEHPEKWAEPASDLVVEAIEEAFPGKKKKER